MTPMMGAAAALFLFSAGMMLALLYRPQLFQQPWWHIALVAANAVQSITLANAVQLWEISPIQEILIQSKPCG